MFITEPRAGADIAPAVVSQVATKQADEIVRPEDVGEPTAVPIQFEEICAADEQTISQAKQQESELLQPAAAEEDTDSVPD